MIEDIFEVGSMTEPGKPRTCQAGQYDKHDDPHVAVGWAIVEQATADLVVFVRAGFLDRSGVARTFGQTQRRDRLSYGPGSCMETEKLSEMTQGTEHYDLWEFFTDPDQCQYFLDLIDCPISADDILDKVFTRFNL